MFQLAQNKDQSPIRIQEAVDRDESTAELLTAGEEAFAFAEGDEVIADTREEAGVAASSWECPE
jgi:hypothetical protein